METLIALFFTYLWPAIVFILVFSFLVMIHEWGHFYAAKKCGVKVPEFGFGFPPRIWGKKFGETLYSINWIPFGGFVRLHGEDSMDPRVLKDPHSFASKPVWKRMIITVAGVVMNLVFAILILTIGFTVGMEPLLVDYNDVLKGMKQGTITYNAGVYTKADGALPLEIPHNVRVISPPSEDIVGAIMAKSDLAASEIVYEHGGDEKTLKLSAPIAHADLSKVFQHNIALLPGFVVHAATADFKRGDRIVTVNGDTVFTQDDLTKSLQKEDNDAITIVRNGETMTVSAPFVLNPSVDVIPFVVQAFSPDSKAKAAGITEGSRIVSVDGESVSNPEHFRSLVSSKAGTTISVGFIPRGGSTTLTASLALGNDGLIGIYMAPLLNAEGTAPLVSTQNVVTIAEIQKEQYPIHEAFVKSFSEAGRLSVLTVQMFGNVIREIFTSGAVPQEIAGPIGIASMTAASVQQGIMAVLRFVALLSLSLAVLNILPIPALDGGRFIFQIFEVITGRRPNQKVEAWLHTVGFLALITMILFVSFYDVVKLVNS